MHKLDKVIGETVRELGLGRDLRRALAVAEWPRSVGERIGRRTAAYMITRSGTLFVVAASPAWAQELTAMRPQLIEKLNARLGGDVVKDIRFQGKGLGAAAGLAPGSGAAAHDTASGAETVGAGPSAGGVTGAEAVTDEPAGTELDALPLDSRDAERIRATLAGTKVGPARDKLEEVLARHAKLSRWRLSRGWRECPGCGGPLPPSGGKKCPVCAASVPPRAP